MCTLILAVFAFAQFGETRRSSERQLRAYIYPDGTYIQLWDDMNPQPLPARPGCLHVTVSVKNSGQTPAHGVLHWGALTVRNVADEDQLEPPAKLEVVSPANVGAGVPLLKSTWSGTVSPADIHDIETGVKAIYVYGKVEYLDAFNKRRYTRYRLKYAGKFPPPPAVSLVICTRGNEAT